MSDASDNASKRRHAKRDSKRSNAASRNRSRRRRLLGQSLESRHLLAVSFQFDFDDGSSIGFNDPVAGTEFRNALQTAADRLGDEILEDATVDISVRSLAFDDGLFAQGASAVPDAIPEGGFADSIITSKVKGNEDGNDTDADGTLDVYFFSPTDLRQYELDPTDVETGEVDFGAVMFHELVHMIGWSTATTASGTDLDGAGSGSPGTWRPFDQHLSDDQGNAFIDADPDSSTAFEMDTTAWGTASVGGAGSDGLFFSGPMAVSVYGGPVPLYSPASFDGGLSVIHLDVADDGSGAPFDSSTHLMTPFLLEGTRPQELTLLEKAMLSDVGVLLREDVAPVIELPGTTLILEANDANGFLQASDLDGTLQAYLNDVTVSDQVDPNPSLFYTVPDPLPIGATQVDVTAFDASDNSDSDQFSILVRDTIGPEIQVDPLSVTVEANDVSGAVGIDLLTGFGLTISANDIVDGDVSIDALPNSFGFGSNEVAVTASDSSNNQSEVTLTVNVVDTTAPVLNLPAEMTIDSNTRSGSTLDNPELLTLLDAAASDIADDDLDFTFDVTELVFGSQTVMVTAIDDAGNEDVQSTTITVNDARLVVTTLNDELDADPASDPNDLSLREAIALANADPGHDVILFSDILGGLQSLDPTLSSLEIEAPVTILGGSTTRRIDAQSAYRVFAIGADAGDVTFENLTILGGRTSEEIGTGAGIRYYGNGTLTLRDSVVRDNVTEGTGFGFSAGTGIYVGPEGSGSSTGNLLLEDSVVSTNVSEGPFGDGVGITFLSNGTLTLNRSTIENNSAEEAESFGGGIYVQNGTVVLESSTIESNGTMSTKSSGGGIALLNGTLTAQNSTFTGNSTNSLASLQDDRSHGAAIYLVRSTATIVNSTFSGNVTADGDGGAIALNQSTLDLIQSTVTDNEAGEAGGGIAAVGDNSSTMTLRGSVVAANIDSGMGEDLFVRDDDMLFATYSFVGDNLGTPLEESPDQDPTTGNIVGSSDGDGALDPMLDGLASNGGLVETHRPLADSPLINAGDPSFDGSSFSPSLDFDSRGAPFQRVFDSQIDIGSIEFRPDVEVFWDPIDAIVYPTPLSSVQLNATANVPGFFNYTPPAGVLMEGGEDQTIRVVFIPDNTELSSIILENQITVLPGTPTLTFEQPDPIVAGTALSSLQLNASSTASGSFTYSPDLGTILNAGAGQTLTATFVPDSPANFNGGSITTTIDVLGERDYGDAPSPYPVSLAENGAHHGSDDQGAAGIFLGSVVDLEVDADVDDSRTEDSDDDGFQPLTTMMVDSNGDTVGGIRLNASADAFVDAWIDFDNSGSWESDEQVLASASVVAGSNVFGVAIPADAVANETVYARFRISSTGGLDPVGSAADGEVEDWPIDLVSVDSNVLQVTPLGEAIATTIEDGRLVIRVGDTVITNVVANSGLQLLVEGTDDADQVSLDISVGESISSVEVDLDSGADTISFTGEGDIDLVNGNWLLDNIRTIDVSDASPQVVLLDNDTILNLAPASGIIEVNLGLGDLFSLADTSGWQITADDPQSSPLKTAENSNEGLQVIANVAARWQNFIDPSDVNNSGGLTPLDILNVVNEIRRGTITEDDGTTLVDPSSVDIDPMVYPDQNGSGTLTPLDVLRVVNEIRRRNEDVVDGEGEGTALDVIASQSFSLEPSLGFIDQALEDWSEDERRRRLF